MKNTSVKVRCPECDVALKVSVSSSYPMHIYRDGSADPPEPALIEEILSPLEWKHSPGWLSKIRQAIRRRMRFSWYYFCVGWWLGWPKVVQVETCPHTEMLFDSDRFYEEVMRVLEDLEMEARYDRWRERGDET